MKKISVLAIVGTIAFSTAVMANNTLRVVGSSTVFPFTTAVSENFGKRTGFSTPVVESTGTGGGMKLFCGGVGTEHPDMTNASRAIKDTEVALCAQNGVNNIIELKVGYDGIVLANSNQGVHLDLTLEQIYRALAAEVPTDAGTWEKNSAVNWNDIDSNLPAIKIEVLGPPPTSGTRDAFVELAMEGGCKAVLKSHGVKYDSKAHKAGCHTIREDGAFVEAGENDNLIVQKLVANTNSYGIFGFSFLDQNLDKLQGSTINGVAPTFDAITDGTYPISRSLFVYIKGEHVAMREGIREFVEEYISANASGEFGYLSDKGLIPLTEDERSAQEKRIVEELDRLK
jgi:phosphate transport system substrate-binding protein